MGRLFDILEAAAHVQNPLLREMSMQLNMMVQLVISGLIFGAALPKKRWYPLRLVLSLLVCIGLTVALAQMRLHYAGLATRFLMRLVQFVMPLTVILLCCQGDVFWRLKTWCAGIAAMEIAASLTSLLLAVMGIDERVSIRVFDLGRTTTSVVDWLFYFAIHIAIYLALFRLANFRRAEELDRRSRVFTTALTLACLVFLTVPDCMSNEYRMVSYPLFLVNRLYLLVLAVFILALCSSIEFQSRYRINMAVMDQVLSEERKQYHQLKDSIDAINILCHDLRHRLEQFSGRLTDEEIGSLRSAMSIYDSTIKTGSEVLDVVFHLNAMACQKEGIQFTVLADGAALCFVETRHLYSLFNNALSNAMEAVRKLDNPDKRVISVSVKQAGETVEIEIFNFFDGCLPGAWDTTKEDRHLHGFGTKSMRYIAQLYGGVLSVQLRKDIYNLHISIPIPTARASS